MYCVVVWLIKYMYMYIYNNAYLTRIRDQSRKKRYIRCDGTTLNVYVFKC
jgi:hypothetical protein